MVASARELLPYKSDIDSIKTPANQLATPCSGYLVTDIRSIHKVESRSRDKVLSCEDGQTFLTMVHEMYEPFEPSRFE